MSEVIITFVGICTHIQNITLTPPPDALSPQDETPGDYSRAVLVNAALGSRIGEQGIPPHEAILHIPKQFVEEPAPDIMLAGLELVDPDAMTWRLKGARMYVTNAEPGMSHTKSYRNVPSLTARAERSLELDPRVVSEGRAAAIFDIFAGHIDAYRDEDEDDAVHVKMQIDVAGAERELAVIRHWDGLQMRLRLKDGLVGEDLTPPHVFVMNTGVDFDKEVDFLLHYDVTTWSPPADTPPVPGSLHGIRVASDAERALLGGIPSGLSIGCSNSNYP
jgi:hypothetical protein